MSKCFISLLPLCTSPTKLLVSDKISCHSKIIEPMPIKYILGKLQRETWIEGLYVRKIDLPKIKRYKNSDGSYKNDFDDKQFLTWVKTIEENIAICDMGNKHVGKGVFVSPKAKLPKGTFIPSSGIIKLNPSREDLETKNHCSVLQDLNSPTKEIYGLIDPGKMGGILDLINHAPEEDEMDNFEFKSPSVKENVAMVNLKGTIKFYNGYAIMGVEAFEDIHGGKFGKQLLWSYAQPDEYLVPHEEGLDNLTLYLFDNRCNHNGEIIDVNHYKLRKVNIFLDTGEVVLRKVASLTRWELMHANPESDLVFSLEDPYSSIQSEAIFSSIPHVFLQTYLKQNPQADRVIIQVPVLKDMSQVSEKKDKK